MKRFFLKRRKRFAAVLLAAVLIAVLFARGAWENTALTLTAYEIDGAPEGLDGLKIAQVSDLHNAQMGENNEKLLSLLKSAAPHLIVITGDMIDSRRTDLDVALAFAEEAVRIAPCYYVTGNHEARCEEYPAFKEGLALRGVTVLDGARATINYEGETLTLIGVGDPSFTATQTESEQSVTQTALRALVREEDGYTVLLSHRPELFETYAECGVDLVFSGHAHGGQIRLPLVGGVIAPNQGLFPKYDAGVYTSAKTRMIVSRGIGNSAFPFRLGNRPEVVIVEF